MDRIGFTFLIVLKVTGNNLLNYQNKLAFIGINVMPGEKQIMAEIISADQTFVMEFETTNVYKNGIRNAYLRAGYAASDIEDDVTYFNRLQRSLFK